MLSEYPYVRNTNMDDPEQALRLDLLRTARIMERVYQCGIVDLDSITRPNVRSRVAAALEPWQLGHLITERVRNRQAVNLDAIRKQYPEAYALYSQRIEQRLRQTAWQGEKMRQAEHAAFYAVA